MAPLYRVMKIGFFPIAILRSIWSLHTSILPVIGVECMCCEIVVMSKFHPIW